MKHDSKVRLDTMVADVNIRDLPSQKSEANYSAAEDDGGDFEALAHDATAASAAPPPIHIVAPENPEGTRIDLVIARLVPQFSRARLQIWLDEGRISIDGATAGSRTRLWGGEAISIAPAPDAGQLAYAPEPLPLTIVFEDADVMVINKPPGLVVHPAAGNWSGTLLNGLLHYAPQLAQVPRAGIVHRLDKDTSGLMVVAKTLEAQTALVRQLQARTVRREYLAVAAGRIEQSGTVEAAIGRHPTQRTLMAVLAAEAPGAKHAVTRYAPLAYYARSATLVQCGLETGRTHQIRVHLRHIAHALVGDQVYGTAPARTWFARQALHAQTLAFKHPRSGKLSTHEVAPPQDMANLMRELASE